MKSVDRKQVKALFPKRADWCHKGYFGKLLIIGGNSMYSGSPALAAMAAIRSGTDLVTVAAPRRVADIIAGFGPDIITYPLKGDQLSAWCFRVDVHVGGADNVTHQRLKEKQIFVAQVITGYAGDLC